MPAPVQLLFRFVTCLASVLCVAHAAHAAEDWLELESSSGCAPDRRALAERIVAQVAGSPDRRHSLRVELSESRGATAARITLLRDGRSSGLKQLEGTSCDELLDAVVAVAALALSSLPSSQDDQPWPSLAAAPRAPVGEPPRSLARDLAASPRGSESPVDAMPAGGEHLRLRWRAMAGAGIDIGTLARATLVLSTGAALRVGAGEVRALMMYGVPSIEELEVERLDRERTDFAAAELDYCASGILAAPWLALCGGVRGTFTRVSRLSTAPGQPGIEQERIDPVLSAVMGANFGYRAGRVQPELEVIAQLPLVGTSAGGHEPGIRTTLGASLPF